MGCTIDVQCLIIGKYLSSLRTFDHVILLKEGFEAQLRASRPSIPFGMSTLGMTRQIRDGCLQGSIQPSHVPALQGLDNVAQDVHGTHGHLACRHGHLHEELSRSEEHTSELQSLAYLVCRLLLEKK